MDITSTTPAPPQQRPVSDDRIREKAEEFEAVYLGMMVNDMLEDAAPEEMGGGFGEDMFRSVMGNAIAERIVDDGGVGLASTIEAQMKAYAKT